MPPGAIPIHVPNGQPPVGQFLMTPNGLIQLQPMIGQPMVAQTGKVVTNPSVKINEQEPIKSVLDLPDDVDVMEGEFLPAFSGMHIYQKIRCELGHTSLDLSHETA